MTQNSINTSIPVEIANGGTGQAAQTAAFDALSPTTTKGDIVVYGASDNVRLAIGTDTHILTADSGETEGVKWAAAAGGGQDVLAANLGYKSGQYYGTLRRDKSIDADDYSLDRIYYIPIYISENETFTILGVHVETAEAGKNFRLALYDTNADGEPNDLLDESGEISAATTGWKEYTGMSEALTQGPYWLAFIADGSNIHTPELTTHDIWPGMLAETTTEQDYYYTESQAYGTFPSTASSLSTGSSGCPCILIGL